MTPNQDVFIEKGSVLTPKETVILRSADSGGPVFDAFQLKEELVGVSVMATVALRAEV